MDTIGQAMNQASAISVATAVLTDADLGSGLIPLTPTVPIVAAPKPVSSALASSSEASSARAFQHQHPHVSQLGTQDTVTAQSAVFLYHTGSSSTAR